MYTFVGPFAHPNEKAKRRDPRKFWYIGLPCPEYKKVHFIIIIIIEQFVC